MQAMSANTAKLIAENISVPRSIFARIEARAREGCFMLNAGRLTEEQKTTLENLGYSIKTTGGNSWVFWA